MFPSTIAPRLNASNRGVLCGDGLFCLVFALVFTSRLGAAERSGFFRWSGGVVYRHLGGVDWRTQSQSPEFLGGYFGPNLQFPGNGWGGNGRAACV